MNELHIGSSLACASEHCIARFFHFLVSAMAEFDFSQAMSHNSISTVVVKFLSKHDDYWRRDKHYKTCDTSCACCDTNKRREDREVCESCANAFSLSNVSVPMKIVVYAFGRSCRAWWWKWTVEHREFRKNKNTPLRSTGGFWNFETNRWEASATKRQ